MRIPANGDMRVHALWQFYRYKRSITGFWGFQMFEYVGEISKVFIRAKTYKIYFIIAF